MLILALLAIVPSALAQDAQPTPSPAQTVTDDDVNAIARQLYCPVCDNVPLDVCGTQACADWRQEIRTQLEQGRTPQEIKAYFVERYGRRVLATPERSGVDLLVWVLPVVGVAAGAVVLVIVLRRMAPGALTAETAPRSIPAYDDLDPEYVARLERELKEFSS
jgi:cytochrome c-type biogenesis protein CcmH